MRLYSGILRLWCVGVVETMYFHDIMWFHNLENQRLGQTQQALVGAERVANVHN